MNATLHTRLTELKREYEKGETRLSVLLQQEAGLRESLLRISGAIQVLEELLAEGHADEQHRGDGAAEAGESAPEGEGRGVDGEPVTMTVP